MANIFVGSEIVKLGIQIEKNGRDFYNTLVNQSKSPQAKEIFKYLASEEEKHIAVFRKVLDSVRKYEPPESYPGEYVAYMNILANEYVFTQKDKGKEIAKSVKSDKEKEQGAKAQCSIYGHQNALRTEDGKIWSILENDVSTELINTHEYEGKEVEIIGKKFIAAQVIEVESFKVL